MAGLLPLALALVAVGLLVALTHGLGFSREGRLADDAAARALAETLPGGFAAVAVARDVAGAGALLRDSPGRVALIAPKGAHLVARLLDSGWRVSAVDDHGVHLVSRELSCTLRLGPAAREWFTSAQRAIAA